LVKIEMATGTFKVTAKTRGYRRNTNKSSSPVTVFALAGLTVVLVATAFLFNNTSAEATGANGAQGPATRLTRIATSPVPAYIGGSTNSITSQTQCIAGDLDTSFNPGGGVTRGVSTTGFAQAVNALAVQPDGKILAGGRFVQNDDSGTRLVARFNTNGSRDTSFSSPGPSDKIPSSAALPRVATLALQSDGKIVIGGDFKINGESRNGIARLNSDGSLDASFNPGAGVNNEILALAVQPDGKIVIGGDFTLYNGVSRPRVARLNADGSLDTSFAPGTGAHSRVNAVGIQADGKIIIAGFFSTYNGVTSQDDLVRINTNGSLDTSFASGTGAVEIRALAIQADGKVVIGGTFTTYNGVGRNRVARVNTNGSLDTSFDPGTGASSTVRTIAIQADGKIVIGGAFNAYNGIVRTNVARINTNGSLDPTFVRGTGAMQFGAFASVVALALQADGKIVVTGAFDTFDGERRNRVARLNADGSLDASFILTAPVSSSVRVIAVQCDGKIIMGGFFDRYDGVSRNNIARVNPDGSLDTTFDPGSGTSGNTFDADGTVEAIVIQPDGKILIGGSFNLYNGVARHKFARLNSNGSLDTSFDPGTGPGEFFANVYAIALQPDGKIMVGGLFPAYNGVSRDGLARSNSDGSIDTTFDPLTTIARVVDDFALQPDGKILIGGNFDKSLGRLNSNGSPDGSFNTGTGENGGLTDLVLQPDGKVLIGGVFTQFNGVGRTNIARINSDGSLDTSFDPGTGPNNLVISLAQQADGKVLMAGDFTQNNGVTRNRVARLNTNGSVDTSFGSGTGADRRVYAVALQPDGQILIGGTFNNYNGTSRNNIARVNSCLLPAIYQFSQPKFAVSESAGFANVTVTRTGDTSTAGTVDYATSDNSAVIPDEAQATALCGTVNGVALSKCDFNTAVGTLRFAPGETSKSFTVLLTQDSYVEGTERAPLTLSNPTNGTILCPATIEITDDPTEPSTNAIDDSRNFVRQHYHDFLNREPDQAGWDFWTDNIAKCNDPARLPAGQTVAQCIDKQRETTSGAFFLSPEFQYTGSYIYGVYKGSLNRRPTFLEFMRDMPQLVNGIIDNGQISGSAIEANRAAYVAQFIQRSEFASIYGALSNQGYVDKLFVTTGTAVSDADKQALVNGLNGLTETRSSVLHKVVNGTRVIAEGQLEVIAVYGKTFYDSQFNPAFVQMEYFGYMRRNEDTAGFDFWLGKLNFYGDFITAEMVRSFLLSPEYRRRFGSQ
jgi:uncharacterized delta-60 repeat protein